MLSNIRKRVKLTPSGVIAVMALVFATTGGAFAMNGGSGGSSPSRASASLTRPSTTTARSAKSKAKSKSKSTTGARGPAGPAGKNGTNGTNGVNGAPGEKGASGPQGPQGLEGKEGKAGAPGKEGKAGTNGTTGFTETLPPGKTETGTWTLSSTTTGFARIMISFPIPLQATSNPQTEPNPLEASQVHFVKAGEPASSACGEGSGGAGVAIPTAAPGNLCIYESVLVGIGPSEVHIDSPGTDVAGAGVAGAMLWGPVEENKEAQGWGTWAVTAPAEA